MVRERILPWLSKAEVRRYGLTLGATSRTIPLMWINIQKEQDKRRPWNISKESCYHRIKCSVANSLTALMWKWYLNSGFQPYSFYTKTSRRCWWDKYQYQPPGLPVERKDEGGREYKRGKRQWEKGIEKLREKDCRNQELHL